MVAISDADRPIVIGGPCDGILLAKGQRPAFIFIGGTHRQPRVYTDPGAGREMYRHLAVEDGREVFVYAGHSHYRCDGCAAFLEITHKDACSFCGHDRSGARS